MPFIVGSTTVNAIAVAIVGIDRVTALEQHAHARLRGERLRAAHGVARRAPACVAKRRKIPRELMSSFIRLPEKLLRVCAGTAGTTMASQQTDGEKQHCETERAA